MCEMLGTEHIHITLPDFLKCWNKHFEAETHISIIKPRVKLKYKNMYLMLCHGEPNQMDELQTVAWGLAYQV